MRRSLLLTLIVGMIAASLVSQAAAAPNTKSRTDTSTYQRRPALFIGDCVHDSESTCVEFETARRESFVSLEVTDATGLPVPAGIYQKGQGLVATFCGGATAAPIPIRGGRPIQVWLNTGATWSKCGPIPATQGTVTATFTTGAE